MTTTPPKGNKASKPGAYSYMDLLSEWQLVNPDASWKQWAACKNADPQIFFPEGHSNFVDAKKYCADCIVYKECMKFALDNGITYGVWGGLSPIERQRTARGHHDTRE